jgi:hypothetical protein
MATLFRQKTIIRPVKNRMIMKKIILIAFISAAVFSCRKYKDPGLDNSNYFTFGNYYGFCSQNCTHIFKISDGKLYQDDMDRFDTILKFNTTPLSKANYFLALLSKSSIPKYLLDHPNEVIGKPDSRDQGSIYIKMFENGVLKTWIIDPDIDQLPIEIRNYISTLSKTIEELK